MLTRRSAVFASASATLLAACAPLRPFHGSLGPREAPELAEQAPPAPREFRAAWVATVGNIDWPSRKGLSSAEQQAEIRSLLDAATALKLNAIILQVRTAADALYPSELEPWSEYLSGTQGQAPQPFYDPLAMWVDEAHARGIELHAWFNPFRARQSTATSAATATHLSQTHPQWVKAYGDQLWIDPGEAEAGEHTLAVFKDVLKRYDVDGIHIDDYFYPYPIQDPSAEAELDFPDEPSWQRYLDSGGSLARADWRRQNVDRLIERVYGMVRATKPWVRFGVSPFGVGQPALRPAGISGFSQYDKLYANVELWLHEGWLDYLVPQLYWKRDQKAQAFEPLLAYWRTQNTRGRHVWPGLFTSRITVNDEKPESWPVDEILGQIALAREGTSDPGHAHFSMIALAQNRRGIADALKAGPYVEAALTPATPWLEQAPPERPSLAFKPDSENWRVEPQAAHAEHYAVWLRRAGQWHFEASKGSVSVPAEGLEAIVVSGLNRVGVEGPRVAYLL